MKIQDISIIISITLRLGIFITTNLLLDSGSRAEYANSLIVYLYTLSIFNEYPTKKECASIKEIILQMKYTILH